MARIPSSKVVRPASYLVAATCCAAVLSNSAHAYRFLPCVVAGKGNVGISSNVTFVTDACSMPAGSVEEGDALAAMGAWNGLVGMANRFAATAGTNTSCSITHGDGQNDIALVPGTNMFLSGANGIAMYVGYTRTPQTCEQNEWDVLINNSGLNPGVPDELDGSAQPRRGTIVHELGHVLGLGHETAGLNSVMAPSGGTVVVTGTGRGTRGYSEMRTDSFVVPEGIGTATGLMLRVGVIVDPNDTISESIESNNGTRLPLTLLVLSC